MTLTIKNAGFGDYNFLCEIFQQANIEHCEMRPDLYRPVEIAVPKLTYLAGIAARHFGHEPVSLQIACLDGKNVGAVFVQSMKRSALSWSAFEKEAYLDNVVVMPDYRRQGIGSALLAAAKNWAKKTGHAHIYGKIIGHNTASLQLFHKSGFQTDSLNVGKHLI